MVTGRYPMRRESTGMIPPLTTPFTVEGDVYEKGLESS